MKARRRRRRHPNHVRDLIIWGGLIIVPLLLILLGEEVENLFGNFQPRRTAVQEPLSVGDLDKPTSNAPPFIRGQNDGESLPRVYPYSVVDGGVHAVQELQSAILRDPVVAEHYSAFKLEKARIIEAKADGDFHVSYRIGDEIFWTKRRLRVAKNEKLITDGSNFARTRCANVLSEVIPGKTSPDEPTPQVFDTPTPVRWDPLPIAPPGGIGGGPPLQTPPPSETAPLIPPVVIEGGGSAPSPLIPHVVVGGGGSTPTLSEPAPVIGTAVVGGRNSAPTLTESTPFKIHEIVGGGGNGEGNPPFPVPEPATLLLLGTGLAGLAGCGRSKFFKK